MGGNGGCAVAGGLPGARQVECAVDDCVTCVYGQGGRGCAVSCVVCGCACNVCACVCVCVWGAHRERGPGLGSGAQWDAPSSERATRWMENTARMVMIGVIPILALGVLTCRFARLYFFCDFPPQNSLLRSCFWFTKPNVKKRGGNRTILILLFSFALGTLFGGFCYTHFGASGKELGHLGLWDLSYLHKHRPVDPWGSGIAALFSAEVRTKTQAPRMTQIPQSCHTQPTADPQGFGRPRASFRHQRSPTIFGGPSMFITEAQGRGCGKPKRVHTTGTIARCQKVRQGGQPREGVPHAAGGCTGVVSIFGPIWFSSTIGFS